MTERGPFYINIVGRFDTRAEAEAWLEANPHPPWEGGKDTTPIAAVTGPFKIVYKERDWLPNGCQWQVLAAHTPGGPLDNGVTFELR